MSPLCGFAGGSGRRVFLAIEPGEVAQKEIARIQKSLSGFDKFVKWVEEENLHLTVKFIGEVKEERLSWLVNKYQDQFGKQSPFRVEFAEKISFYPSNASPRVLLIDVRVVGEAGQLIPRSMHLTLGRVRKKAARPQKKRLVKQAQEVGLGKLAGFELEVREIALKQSRLSSRGPVYTDIQKFPLVKSRPA